MISMLFSAKRRGFIEMMLHHLICIFLYGGGYLMNILHSASIVAFLHDSSDICITFSKMFVETHFERINLCFFIANLFSWGLNRLVYFPVLIYEIHTYSALVTDWNRFCVFNFTFMLSCLFLLHCYWYTMFINILIKYMFKGEREDLIHKIEMKKTSSAKAQ